MRAVLFAYEDTGCIGLEALLRHGFDVRAVFTHVDESGEAGWFESVAETACERGIAVYAPADVNQALWVQTIARLEPDVVFSFAYRSELCNDILELPESGCFALHGSLLPAYRGRDPIRRALAHGEKRSGVTLHHMTPLVDDGDIVDQQAFDVTDDDTAKTLIERAGVMARQVLDRALPLIRAGEATRTPQGRGRAADSSCRKLDPEIDWFRPATEVRNLVRALTRPYPGAFSHQGTRRTLFWSVSEIGGGDSATPPGTILCTSPLEIACGFGALRVDSAQEEGGVQVAGAQLAEDMNLVAGTRFGPSILEVKEAERRRSVLILGVNGFIGNALAARLLEDGRFDVHGMDLRSDNVRHLIEGGRLEFTEGDIGIHRDWIEHHVKKCDVVVPLASIATPIESMRSPLRVFELDFEENLRIVRHCARYGKRVVFPSASEVYGLCDERRFDEDRSNLVLGPINRQRWIYACSKQLLDRVIWALGREEGLRFTLFRPFSWIGARLDSLDSARIGSSRVITRLIVNLVDGSPIQLVDGGRQKRCFTDVSEGIECLFRIIENKNETCDGKIINIGNPENEASIRELAEMVVSRFEQHPLRHHFPPFAGFREVSSREVYGSGYQDGTHRRPSIRNAQRYVGWTPSVALDRSVDVTLDYFLHQQLDGRKRS